MTFCGRLKEELAKAHQKTCCKAAGLFGMLLFSAEFSEKQLRTVTGSKAVCKRMCDDMRSLFGFAPDVKVSKRKDGDFYILTLKDTAKLDAIMKKFYPRDIQRSGINHMMLQSECDKLAFLRGAFLTAGTVTDPEKKSYYFDFTTSSLKLSEELFTLLSEYELSPKTLLRRGVRVIYFKGGENIEAVLQTLGAFQSYFEFVNIRIEKEMQNDLNRTMNCDSANAQKTRDASKKQIEAIELLKSTDRLDGLSDDLKTLALLRLENDDMSLTELGKLCEPRLSKTAVYTRLCRLVEIASKISQ
ncbi:MAG: DNA-binding protein WhiA [Clostridia bacterium]|nr:DNA-binding protein WhiA [Clostridia bacterium]